jgi:hypothetical protein
MCAQIEKENFEMKIVAEILKRVCFSSLSLSWLSIALQANINLGEKRKELIGQFSARIALQL